MIRPANTSAARKRLSGRRLTASGWRGGRATNTRGGRGARKVKANPFRAFAPGRPTASPATAIPWPLNGLAVYAAAMNTPPLNPWTETFLAGIRQRGLAEAFQILGLPTDVLANALERAANDTAIEADDEAQREGLRQAVAMAVEEARQLRARKHQG